MHARGQWEEHSLHRAVSGVLLAGLVVAAGLMLNGLGLAALRGAGGAHVAQPLGVIPRGLAAGEPGAFLSAGVLALLVTPALRVVLLCAAYVRQGRWLFAGLSLCVLAVMALSVVLGLR